MSEPILGTKQTTASTNKLNANEELDSEQKDPSPEKKDIPSSASDSKTYYPIVQLGAGIGFGQYYSNKFSSDNNVSYNFLNENGELKSGILHRNFYNFPVHGSIMWSLDSKDIRKNLGLTISGYFNRGGDAISESSQNHVLFNPTFEWSFRRAWNSLTGPAWSPLGNFGVYLPGLGYLGANIEHEDQEIATIESLAVSFGLYLNLINIRAGKAQLGLDYSFLLLGSTDETLDTEKEGNHVQDYASHTSNLFLTARFPAPE